MYVYMYIFMYMHNEIRQGSLDGFCGMPAYVQYAAWLVENVVAKRPF